MLKRLSSIVATPRGLNLQIQITSEKMLSLDSSLMLERLPISVRTRLLTNSAGTLVIA